MAKPAGNAPRVGVIVNPVAPDTIRLAPPLILTTDQADSFIATLGPVLDAVHDAASRGLASAT